MDSNLDNFLSQICVALQRAVLAHYPRTRYFCVAFAGMYSAHRIYCFSAAFFYPYGNGQLCILRCFAFLFQQWLQQEVKL